MKLKVFKVILVLFFIIIESSLAVSSKKLIVLGDSLSEGYGVAKESAYPALLEKKINTETKKNYQVINAGVSGSTTASALGRMKWLIKQKPEYIFLALGANDGLRGLKLEDSQKNLEQAIEYAQKEKVKIILGGLYMPPNYGKDYTEKFKKIYLSLASKYKVPVVPFILDKVAGDPKLNLADGIHPNEEGHKIIAGTIFQAIQNLL
jgi:acyl-CoA thioesterase-1